MKKCVKSITITITWITIVSIVVAIITVVALLLLNNNNAMMYGVISFIITFILISLLYKSKIIHLLSYIINLSI